MNILLGVFGTPTFRELKERFELKAFGSFDSDLAKETNPVFDCTKYVIHTVNGVMNIADQIFFDLTHIDFEVRENTFKIHTYCELFLCITTPEYLNKARFFINGIDQNKQKIVDQFIFQEYWNQYL